MRLKGCRKGVGERFFADPAGIYEGSINIK